MKSRLSTASSSPGSTPSKSSGACSPLVLRMSAATVEMTTLGPAARPVVKVILAPKRESGSATLLSIEIPTL
jgi:hypothetical protein